MQTIPRLWGLLAFIFLVGDLRLAASQGICRADYESFGPMCYKFFSTTMTWDSAEAECIREGGHLATIFDPSIQTYLSSSQLSSTCWIGASRPAGSSSWSWSRPGVPFSQSYFLSGQPDISTGSRACAAFCSGSNPAWCDENCGSQRPFICEYQALCQKGEYMDSSRKCNPCQAGRYYDGYANQPNSCLPCPAGRYGTATGEPSSQCTGACAKGHYCPQGSTSATAAKCPAGRYGATNGLGAASCSGLCSPGKYGVSVGVVKCSGDPAI